MCARRNWHGARTRCSRDQLRRRMGQHGAALARGRGGGCVRSSESAAELGPTARSARQRAGRRAASPRARRSTHYSPRAPVSLTRRLRRAVAVWPEEPGLTPAPTLLRRSHLLLHGHRPRPPPRPAPPRSAPPRARGAAMRGACAAPPAQRRLHRAAFAATPAPRRLTPRRLRRDASRRDACAATPHAATPAPRDASRRDACAATPAPRRLTPRRRARRRLARLRTAPRRLARDGRVSAPRRLARDGRVSAPRRLVRT